MKDDEFKKEIEFNYMPIIIFLIFGIGIAFIIGMYIGWHNGFKVATTLLGK